MKYLMYAFWMLTIIIGAVISKISSMDNLYIIGFTIGSFATMFIILAEDFKE